MQDIYNTVTDSIITELEKGAAPWVKPWKADSSADKNFISQKPYQGINRLLLGMSSMAHGYSNPAYAFEELVAEMSAAFLCADYRIQGELRHAGYIQHWLKACRDDSKAIFKAAALAQKAVDYIQALDATAESIAA